jgi:hypothetical protein
MSDVLSEKFCYKVTDDKETRRQSLRNAYIYFGFSELKTILKSMEMNDDIMSDIDFLIIEEQGLN